MWRAFASLRIKGELKPRADNLVFRLHYRYTFLLFMAAATLTTLYDLVGRKIDCMMTHDDGGLKRVVDSYCYITGTFTVDKHHYSEVGKEIPFQGVGPHKPEDDITYHAWYQWVPFVLVAQGALFYLPHLIWKRIESGFFRSIIQDLSIKDYLGVSKKGTKLGNYFSRQEQFKALAIYLTDYSTSHRGWAIKFIGCETLNVIFTTLTVVFTNYFLGGEFYQYGTSVFSMSEMDPENRTDPMSRVFPTMAKCSFKLFGPSGTIENRDVMCLLPTNIANEKIFLTLWFWLTFLAVVGIFWLLVRQLSMVKYFRDSYFVFRYYTIPHRSLDNHTPLTGLLATEEEVRFLLDDSTFGDYLLLCQLADNMETTIFTEFLKYLARYRMEKIHGSQDTGLESVKMNQVPNAPPEKINYPDLNSFPMNIVTQQH